ncbi:PREDICTED: protein zyg-11 homolog B [Ceratosolen solmsi marchali]|uniref:Protein zyg-11 homolog B n=1 Tax=Ceratosolen solmsi marchali TaxID=326594 RepID=A0AAJ6YGQ3_9HYME|nr:PREDICTED: protein zyg-11 homolog B [Ceratosolen solmsi marchali]
MFESPKSLQEVCIDYICDNVMAFCDYRSDYVLSAGRPPDKWALPSFEDESDSDQSISSANELENYDFSDPSLRLSFKDPNTFLPTEISEQLLYGLCEREKLSNLSITLFDSKTTRLRQVKLKDASTLTATGLNVLKQHKIIDLEVNGLKIAVCELIFCLSKWSRENLRSLNIAKAHLGEDSIDVALGALGELSNLQVLNISGMTIDVVGLELVIESLPLLENLDISCTEIDDISPLRKCKHRLKALSLYNVKISRCRHTISVLLELDELRNLDISDERDLYVFEVFTPIRSKLTDLLKATYCMPNLVNLDISGKDEIDGKDLWNFIQAHKNLKFLGLVHSDACFEDCLMNPFNKNYRPDLVVSGTATESQILEALRRYPNRPIYVQKCLYHLFRQTAYFKEVRVDVIKLVIPGMREHPQEFRVQMAATACLYNLTKGELATKIHPSVLKQIVDLTLTAMESYPAHYQLQKNTLLTLCSDRILQDVAFDKYRCAKLVMNCLSNFDDPSMNRMSVAICSILAAKISTVETSMLGAVPHYMSKLLSMVRSKVQSKIVDITMKFTLSALWNLTDESATTCKVFLEEGGMELFMEVLLSFEGESSVETKVLGLLNNIAEVADLRHQLIQPRFLSMLSVLLESKHIDVSYFAAGIAAHLLSDDPHPQFPARYRLLNHLTCVITNWHTPQGEMVAYRSFQPFFPLLRCKHAHPVQLWAVWAIHHVCTKNPKRYCEMLVREGGVKILESLHKESMYAGQVRVHNLCRAILDTLAQQPC